MDTDQIARLAQALYMAHGDMAEEVAAAKAREAGATKEAEDWQAVLTAVRQLLETEKT